MTLDQFIKFISQTSPGKNIVFVDLDGTLHLGKYPRATDSYSNADFLRLIYSNLVLKKAKYLYLHFSFLIFAYCFLIAKIMQLSKLISLNSYERTMIMLLHYLITPFISEKDLKEVARKTVTYAYPNALETLKYLFVNHYEIVLITKAHSYIAEAYKDELLKHYEVISSVYANPHIKNYRQGLQILTSQDKYKQAENHLNKKVKWNRIILFGNGKDDLGMVKAALKYAERKNNVILVSVGDNKELNEFSHLHINNYNVFNLHASTHLQPARNLKSNSDKIAI